MVHKLRQRLKSLIRYGVKQITRQWSPYSHLFLVSDSPNWVISNEMKELSMLAKRLGVPLAPSNLVNFTDHQSVFFGSHFNLLLKDKWIGVGHHLGTAYFHGRPGTGVEEFDQCYKNLCRFHDKIHRIQVSYSEMRDIVLSSGIAPEKVFLIPIGINLRYFSMQTSESRKKARLKYGIPQSAVVIGSFQKDGNGWGEGLEPKLVKGPDIFIKTLENLKNRVTEIFVLLSGPARGYVKAELERIGVPYRHFFLKRYSDIGELYQALDLYLVSSRQEGGPKAVLESMATGVPLVTTRVGQTMDLVKHGINAWMVDVGDVEGLAYWAEYALQHKDGINNIILNARQVAENNSYIAQLHLWKDFMKGFVGDNRL